MIDPYVSPSLSFVRLHYSYNEVGSDICGGSHLMRQLQWVQSDDVSLLHVGEVDDDISGHLLLTDTLHKPVQSDKEATSLDVLVLVLVDKSRSIDITYHIIIIITIIITAIRGMFGWLGVANLKGMRTFVLPAMYRKKFTDTGKSVAVYQVGSAIWYSHHIWYNHQATNTAIKSYWALLADRYLDSTVSGVEPRRTSLSPGPRRPASPRKYCRSCCPVLRVSRLIAQTECSQTLFPVLAALDVIPCHAPRRGASVHCFRSPFRI